MTRVVIVSSPQLGGSFAAQIIEQLLRTKTNAVLGLATGSTLEHVYHSLNTRGVRLHEIQAFMLDEYVGIPQDHPLSYWSEIQRNVVIPLGLNSSNLSSPLMDELGNSNAGMQFEQKIASAGGIDLQLLGIGRNGHIAFNEPGSSLASRTRVASLAKQTRKDNARYFGSLDEVPTLCATQGVGTILEARQIVLLAFGREKSSAVAAAVEGPISSSCPASAIQLHPRVTVIIDEGAAKKLLNTQHYRDAFSTEQSKQAKGL